LFSFFYKFSFCGRPIGFREKLFTKKPIIRFPFERYKFRVEIGFLVNTAAQKLAERPKNKSSRSEQANPELSIF